MTKTEVKRNGTTEYIILEDDTSKTKTATKKIDELLNNDSSDIATVKSQMKSPKTSKTDYIVYSLIAVGLIVGTIMLLIYR